MTNETKEIINAQSKTFSFHRKLPKIKAIVTASLLFIWALIDSVVLNSSYNYVSSYVSKRYGIFGFKSQLLCFIFWLAVGALITAVTYFSAKLKCSHKILQIEYLKEISASIDKSNDE